MSKQNAMPSLTLNRNVEICRNRVINLLRCFSGRGFASTEALPLKALFFLKNTRPSSLAMLAIFGGIHHCPLSTSWKGFSFHSTLVSPMAK